VILKQIKPKFLFLSCTMIYNLVETLSLVDRVKDDYVDLEIGLGGHALSFLESDKKEVYDRHLLGNTKEEWDAWLDARVK
jgi:hypothetical protein